MSSHLQILWLSADQSAPGQLAERFPVTHAASIGEALRYLQNEEDIGAVVVQCPPPQATAAEALRLLGEAAPQVPALVLHAEATVEEAVRLARLGAWDVLPGADAARLAARLEAALEERRSQSLARLGAAVAGEPWRQYLVGESPAMREIIEIIRLVRNRRCTVLITGETGTGKEMAARALHMASPRAHRPLVTVNCSALPEPLLEAELFGHVKGAFTGAVTNRIGRIEQAHGGTLFLDEIGDMPVDLQAKLLRVLQEREFQRLGSSETIRVDVRVVAASNRNLAERVREGKFREDLYYRLNVVPIQMPPLRERLSDVPLLVYHFIEKICRQEGIPPKQIVREALDRLRTYSWPGNVRELENVVEKAIALSGERPVLYPSDFPLPQERNWKDVPAAGELSVKLPEDGIDFEAVVSRFEWSILEQALRRAGGNKTRAASLLRLKRTTLAAKLRALEAKAGC
ncbi:MAG TPA: sigma-54 dependent transcriptional regulator [Bryobacteraceae bacterium]|nr:sigma-54 dependent transcriptional regulator [Bryobacteraceae bacterium]